MGVFVNLRRIKLHVSVRVEDLNGKAAASGHDVQVELAGSCCVSGASTDGVYVY